MPHRPGWKYYLGMFAAACALMVIHEAAHWLAGQGLGYDMWMKLNRAGYFPGSEPTGIHRSLITAAGPVLTLTAGVLGAWLCIYKKVRWGYALIFPAFMHRAVAMMFSLFGQHNDEARLSMEIGWPWWALPAGVVTLLLVLTILSSRALRFGAIVNVLAYLVVSLAMFAVVWLDGELPGQDGRGIMAPLLPEGVGRPAAEGR